MSETDFKVELGAALAITEATTKILRACMESGPPTDMLLARSIIERRRGAGAVEKLRLALLAEATQEGAA